MRGNQPIPRAPWPVTPYDLGLLAIALLTAMIAAALTLSPAGPPDNGAVLGATQVGPAEASVASPTAAASPPTVFDLSAVPSASPSPAQEDPGVTVGRATIRTWKDSFGRSRLQVIVPVRNGGDDWIHLPEASSTYRVTDADKEVASGGLIALPGVIGPGEVAYLVDTITAPGADRIRGLVAKADVVALPADPPATKLVVTDVRFTTGVRGGLLASGTVHNDSGTATRQVIAGAVALGRNGRPLAALYDSFDVGRLDPDGVKSFVTDSQPGGPPIRDGDVSQTVGIAFESSR